MLAPTARAAPHPIVPAKNDLRRRMTARTDPSRDDTLIEHLAALLADPAPSISFFWPLDDEPDLRPLMYRLDAEGRSLFLPVVAAPDRPLVFRPWHARSVMQAGPLGTRHPEANPGGHEGRPSIILVPVIAFDRDRHRLGRGGGFYDRTLAAHPEARSIGVARAGAEVHAVPIEPHDHRLDAIVTDRGTV